MKFTAAEKKRIDEAVDLAIEFHLDRITILNIQCGMEPNPSESFKETVKRDVLQHVGSMNDYEQLKEKLKKVE